MRVGVEWPTYDEVVADLARVEAVDGLDEVGGLAASLLPLLRDLGEREGDVGRVEVLEGAVLRDLQQHVAQLGRAGRRSVADGGVGVQPACNTRRPHTQSNVSKNACAVRAVRAARRVPLPAGVNADAGQPRVDVLVGAADGVHPRVQRVP